MRNTILYRIITCLLVLALTFTIVPITTFAANNGEIGNGNSSLNNNYNGNILYSYSYGYGFRFSLYFAEGATEDSIANGSAKFQQIGETIDVLMTDSTSITQSTKESVYDYMKTVKYDDGTVVTDLDNILNFTPQTASFVNREAIKDSDGNPVLNKTPMVDLLSTSSSNGYKYVKNYAKTDLNKYFMGVESYDKSNPAGDDLLDFTNSTAIANYILSLDSTYASLGENDFRDGTLTRNGEKVKGIFKLFYEPFFGYDFGGTKWAYTYRDTISYYLVYGDALYTEQNATIVLLANRVYLAEDEPYINMKGNTAGFQFSGTSWNARYNEVTTNALKGNAGYDSLGVGVVTGGIYNSKETPEIIKTYVYLDSVDENGKISYKKAASTTIEDAEFLMDGDKISTIPAFDTLEYVDGGRAYLNDIVAVDEDLTITANSEWVNTELPSNVGVDLKTDASDIAGYLTGIITDSQIFVDTYEIEAQKLDSSTAVISTLNKVTSGLTDTSEIGSAKLNSHIELSLFSNRGRTGAFYVKVAEATKYEYFKDVKLGMVDAENDNVKISEEEAKALNISTPANSLILRYIIKPTPVQINVIEVVNEDEGTTTYISGGIQDLQIDDALIVTVQDPKVTGLENFGELELIEWVSNSEFPLKDISNGTLPPKSSNGVEGSERSILHYPTEPIIHNLYVKWRVIKKTPPKEPGKYFVPQWRLSRYFDKDQIPDGYAMMSLPVTYGCCGLARLDPSGLWNYTTRNPNGEITQPDHSQMKFKTWIHSETVKTDSVAYIDAYNPTAIVRIDGVMNGIKSTDTSGIKVASWLNVGSIEGLKYYDISADTKGGSGTQSRYTLSTILPFNTLNLDTYINTWPYGYDSYDSDGNYCGHYHVWAYSKGISPLEAAYYPYNFFAEIDYARYIAEKGSKLTVASNIKQENGLTTVTYQVDDELKIVPEVPMLFDNDRNESSIKWAAGEKIREINPVIYHTMQYKVFVDKTSYGTSVATDSRATQWINQYSQYKGLQVIYKGAGVNTSYRISRSSTDKTQTGMLTVKTFALDITTNKNGVNLKSAWGAENYKPTEIHETFLSKWGFDKGIATSRLEIDGVANYIGADVQKNLQKYAVVTYGGKTVTEFEHQLIVRGGTVVGVRLQDRNSLAYSTVQIADLEAKDPALYNALLNMKLIGENKDATLFKGFEHKTGAVLDEQKYLNMVGEAKLSADGFRTDNINMGEGWYSEDSTVLVVKELVTNYNVPSVSVDDKISLTVNGLTTPTNKNQFFSTIGTGHSYIKYTITAELSSIKSDLGKAEAYFEHTSRLTNAFGNMTVDYLVPNVSITDTTRLS